MRRRQQVGYKVEDNDDDDDNDDDHDMVKVKIHIFHNGLVLRD